MRVPVHRIKGKAAAQMPIDILADELSKRYTVVRDRVMDNKGDMFVASIALPDKKLVVEIQEKQADKAILAEMSRERITRSLGWRICRLNDRDLADIDTVFYKVDREIRG